MPIHVFYTLLCPFCLYVRNATGNMCFSAAIEYRQLKFLVKIPNIDVHLIYTLFCPSVRNATIIKCMIVQTFEWIRLITLPTLEPDTLVLRANVHLK